MTNQTKLKSRKELFRCWSQERVDAFLEAERGGKIKEVPGGWIIDGRFMEKMPCKGELLTSYLQFLAYEASINDSD